MANTLFSKIRNIVMGGFSLESLPGFPYQAWADQNSNYDELEKWYGGNALNDTVKVKEGDVTKNVAKYPLKINPIPKTVEKHVSVIMGSTIESVRHGGMPVQFRPNLEAKEAKRIKRIVDGLNDVFVRSGAGALFLQNATISQYLGGCVFSAKFTSANGGEVNVSNPNPREFVGIPNGINFFDLREAWIVRKITESSLASYGFTKADFQFDGKYWYIEHYTRKSYEVMVNGKIATDEEGDQIAGENPFNVVPVLYIPHIRTSNLIGNSIITEAAKGIIREINLRTADLGDSISDDSHKIVAIRNVKQGLKFTNIDGRPVVDLGNTTGMSANESQPDIISPTIASTAAPALTFVDVLMEFYRQEVSHPAVADGIDGGSQRSSKTLDSRMWPLQSHVEQERIFWTVGLMFFARILLKMMAVKGLNEITLEDVDVQMVIEWQPMLARDRDSQVTEAVSRVAAKLGSVRTLMRSLGDISDPDAEIAQMKIEKEIFDPVPPDPVVVDSNAPTDNNTQQGGKKKTEPVTKEKK